MNSQSERFTFAVSLRCVVQKVAVPPSDTTMLDDQAPQDLTTSSRSSWRVCQNSPCCEYTGIDSDPRTSVITIHCHVSQDQVENVCLLEVHAKQEERARFIPRGVFFRTGSSRTTSSSSRPIQYVEQGNKDTEWQRALGGHGVAMLTSPDALFMRA